MANERKLTAVLFGFLAASWVIMFFELVQLLVQVREEGNYRGWGYDDFMTYCQQELSLSAATWRGAFLPSLCVVSALTHSEQRVDNISTSGAKPFWQAK